MALPLNRGYPAVKQRIASVARAQGLAEGYENGQIDGLQSGRVQLFEELDAMLGGQLQDVMDYLAGGGVIDVQALLGGGGGAGGGGVQQAAYDALVTQLADMTSTADYWHSLADTRLQTANDLNAQLTTAQQALSAANSQSVTKQNAANRNGWDEAYTYVKNQAVGGTVTKTTAQLETMRLYYYTGHSPAYTA